LVLRRPRAAIKNIKQQKTEQKNNHHPITHTSLPLSLSLCSFSLSLVIATSQTNASLCSVSVCQGHALSLSL
jgi:hypothetical protein